MTNPAPAPILDEPHLPGLRHVPWQQPKCWLLLAAIWGAVLYWLVDTSYLLNFEPFFANLTPLGVAWRLLGGGLLLLVALFGTRLIWQQAYLYHERNLLWRLIDSVPDQLYIKDLDGRFTIANISTAQKNGFSRTQDIIGKSDHDCYSVEIADRYRAEELRVLRGELPLLRDESAPDDLYQEEYWLALKQPLLDEAGNIIGLVGVERNITAQKRVEMALRATNINLQATLNALPVFLLELDAAGIILDYHSANPDLFFDDTVALGQQTIFAMLPAEAGTAVQAALADCQEKKHSSAFTYRVERPTGTAWFECHISPKLLAEDDAERFIMLAHDSTARLRFERELAEERNLLRTLIDTLPEYIFIKDRASRFLLHNVAHAQNVVNHSTTDAITNLTDFDIHGPEAAQEFYEAEQRMLQTGEAIFQSIHPIELADGETIWVSTSKAPLRDTSGEISGLVGVSHNITDLRRQSEEREKLLAVELEQRLIAETLNEVTLVLVSQSSPAAVFDAILQQVRRIVDYTAAHISVIEGGYLQLMGWQAQPGYGTRAMVEASFAEYPLTEIPVYTSISAELTPLLIPDTHQHDNWTVMADFEWIRSHMLIPITLRGDLLGMLMLDNVTPQAFSEADIRFLQPLANAAAIALENARLYEQAQQEIAERRQVEAALQEAFAALEERVQERTAELAAANTLLQAEIQEHLQTERARRESDERFRSAFVSAAIGMAVVALDGRLLQVNQAICRIAGYDEPALLAMSYLDIVLPEDAAKVGSAIAEAIVQKAPVQLEVRQIRSDGRIIWGVASISPVWTDQDTPLYVVVQVRDITDRKNTDAERQHLLATLRHRNIQLETASAVSMSVSTILDPPKLCLTVVNLIQERFDYYYCGLFLVDEPGEYAVLQAGTGDVGRQMLAVEHRLVIGGASMIGQCIATCETRFAPDVSLEEPRYDNPFLLATQAELAMPLLTRSGCIGALTVHSDVPGVFTGEDVTVLQAIAEQVSIAIENARLYDEAQVEITRRIKVEQAIKHLNETLERRVDERTAELAAANRELEAFAYAVSHDLRAPLRSIAGFSQAVQEDYRDLLPAEGQDYLDRVQAASKRMDELITALLELSRVTRTELNRETVNMSEMAAMIIAGLQSANPDRQVELKIVPDLTVRGDSRLLGIVLQNLLHNAWKFTEQREIAVITFGRTRHEEREVFFVQDNGAGFDMAYANKLFGAFQRLHSSREFEGNGVGLTTVQRIVQRHGGAIWAEGAVNEGATFYFYV